MDAQKFTQRLISESDSEQIQETLERSQKRLSLIVKNLTEGRLDEDSQKKLENSMIKEAQKLERLMILEGISDKNFFELQKHFRSMVRSANVVATWLKGTDLSAKIGQLRTQGIELLNDLYDHIKTLEAGVDLKKTGVPLDKELSKKRDEFVKVFTDFAVLFRGIMAIADLFSDDPTSVSGFTDVRDAIMAVEREDMTDEPFGQALSFYDTQARDVGASFGINKGGLAKKLGFGKTTGHVGRVKNALTKAAMSKSPGFAKMVNVPELVNYLFEKSLDQLMAIFGRFNDFVSNDVNVDYLLKMTKNPTTIGGLFKSVIDTLSGGHMKMIR